MPRNLTVAQIVNKWAERGAASGDAVKAGVNAVTDSPMEKAAAAKDKWVAGVQRAAANGTYENRLRAVPLSEWKRLMVEKGIPNMQTGYQAGKRKFERFMNEFMPYVRQMSQEVRAMPRNNIQDSIARARRAIEILHAFKGRLAQAPPPRPL